MHCHTSEVQPRYSVLPALTLDGVIYSEVRFGAFNGDMFLDFLDNLLEVMNPHPLPHSVLVLDNCAIHHVDGVAERCFAAGVKLVYLPPYSPDLNPIEEAFSAFKAHARRFGDYFRAAMETGIRADTLMWIYEALDTVMTAENAKGWFKHAGYV